jgi:hypothetical protein
MAITYYMLQIPPWLFFVAIVFTGIVIGVTLTFLFHKVFIVKILHSHNEVTTPLFLVIGSFYALLLSFIMLVVWEQSNETHSTVSKEGSSAMGLYRDIKFYPDKLVSDELMKVYLNFVYDVVDDEFPAMDKMKLSPKTSDAFNRVFYAIEHLNPETPFQIQLVSEMFRNLNELATYRGLRITAMESEIAPALWLPMILGAFITLFCSILLDIGRRRIHYILNALLGAIIGAFLFIIILMDHPFTGSLGIEPKTYMHIFSIEKRMHETQPTN